MPASLNAYGYAGANPALMLDPTGLAFVLEDLGTATDEVSDEVSCLRGCGGGGPGGPGGPSGGGIRPKAPAASTAPSFSTVSRVEAQLQNARLGPLTGRLSTPELQTLVNNPSARRFFDAASGHINILQEVEGVHLRITVARDSFRIISVGPFRERSIRSGIESGRYIEMR